MFTYNVKSEFGGEFDLELERVPDGEHALVGNHTGAPDVHVHQSYVETRQPETCQLITRINFEVEAKFFFGSK